jgi:hypothetical protein
MRLASYRTISLMLFLLALTAPARAELRSVELTIYGMD